MNADFILAIGELGKEKGIDPELLFQAVEEALVTAYKKNFGSNQNVRVDMNKVTGELHIYAQRHIVAEVGDDPNEISLEEARKIDPRYEVDDIVETEVTPRNFGRIAAQNAKQVVVQRIREAERGMVFEKFSSRENDIVTGIIQRMENKNVYIDLGKAEAILTPNEQIPGEIYQYHDRMKTYIVEVKKTSKGPQIMVSRTHPGLLKRLFELEVPEIHDGLVEIKSVAREPGMRSRYPFILRMRILIRSVPVLDIKVCVFRLLLMSCAVKKSISSNTVPSLTNMWLMPYRQLRLSVLKFWKKKKSAAL